MNYPEPKTLNKGLIFDSHSHYDDEKFDDVRDELLLKLPSYGVCGVVTCGCDGNSSRKAIALAEKYRYIYAAVGLHPECIEKQTTILEIEQLAKHNKCVAIGEIGLDYYWDKEHSEEQIRVFKEQIELANKIDKPIIVHDRDAHADTLSILQQMRPKGVVHCFSGSPETAAELMKIGMYIGVGGVVTFKNSKRLPEVVQMLPDDRILVETDCPYLAPEPNRGKLCHSGLIQYTAEKIAEIRNTTVEHIYEISCNNAKKLFGL